MPTTSRFAEHDEELSRPAARPITCRLCLFLRASPKVDARFITGLLADPGKGSAHIARVLAAGGVEITESSVKRHRQNHSSR